MGDPVKKYCQGIAACRGRRKLGHFVEEESPPDVGGSCASAIRLQRGVVLLSGSWFGNEASRRDGEPIIAAPIDLHKITSFSTRDPLNRSKFETSKLRNRLLLEPTA